MFYNENVLALSFGIELTSFIFYILWATILIFVSVIVDSLLYNSVLHYSGLNILEYLNESVVRFQQRKQSWMGYWTS